MISYNAGRWHLAFVLSLRGSVFPKAVCFAIPAAVLTCVVRWNVGEPYEDKSVSSVLSSYNFVIGFLIVFRTQQAYQRFTEGATLLQQVRGMWLNAASSLIAFSSQRAEQKEEVQSFHHLLIRLFSLLHCVALQEIADMDDEGFDILDPAGIEPACLSFLATVQDSEKSEILLQWIQRLTVDKMNSGVLPIPAPVITRVFQELSNGIVTVTDAMKIRQLPFPFPYAQMISVMLMINTVTTPLFTGFFVESMYWAPSLTFVVVFAFWSINYIAAELEMPFGDDANDLPIAGMQRSMNISLMTLLHDRVQTAPTFDAAVASSTNPIISCRFSVVNGESANERRSRSKVSVINGERAKERRSRSRDDEVPVIQATSLGNIRSRRTEEKPRMTAAVCELPFSSGDSASSSTEVSPRLYAASAAASSLLAEEDIAVAGSLRSPSLDAPKESKLGAAAAAPAAGHELAGRAGETKLDRVALQPAAQDWQGIEDQHLISLALRVEERLGKIVKELVQLLVPTASGRFGVPDCPEPEVSSSTRPWLLPGDVTPYIMPLDSAVPHPSLFQGQLDADAAGDALNNQGIRPTAPTTL